MNQKCLLLELDGDHSGKLPLLGEGLCPRDPKSGYSVTRLKLLPFPLSFPQGGLERKEAILYLVLSRL